MTLRLAPLVPGLLIAVLLSACGPGGEPPGAPTAGVTRAAAPCRDCAGDIGDAMVFNSDGRLIVSGVVGGRLEGMRDIGGAEHHLSAPF